MKKIFTPLLLILLSGILYAESLQTFAYSENKVTFSKLSGFDQVFYDQLDLTSQPGLPQLPFEIFHLNSSQIDSFEILAVDYRKIAENINLFPVQPPQILSLQEVKFQAPLLSKISRNCYPDHPVEILHSGKIGKNKISSYRVFPLKYENNSLFILQKLTVKFHTAYQKPKVTTGFFPVQEQIVENLTQSGIMKTSSGSSDINEYLIITSEELSSSFLSLQTWKNKKGLSAKILTTEWIESQFSGKDLQEKIRNCIKEYHENKSTSWVLLAGDTQIIPDRKAWAFDCEANYAVGENEIPCDLYYADLEGTWNDDGDEIYGEVEDNIDLYSDIFIGRAPVENNSEASAFVQKLLSYEKCNSRDYQTKMMFLSQILWHEPYTNSGESKDLIDERYVPEQFDPILKLYEAEGTARKTTTLEALNQGMNIINHDGHAWYNSISLGAGSLGYTDMMNLQNADKYGILYSIGCWPAAFDQHAVAENFLTNANGGGVAFVGNSRYGWGSPGNPLFGYSDRFDQQFFKQLLIDDIYKIGATLAATKAFYAPLANQENVYRWCEYEINLLGDPEMPVFTEIPKELVVTFPHKISAGQQQFSIFVTDSIHPVSNCTVCLMQENGTYFVGQTGSDGILNFEGLVSNVSSELLITATAHNFIPFEDKIEVISPGAFLILSKVENDELFTSTPNSGTVLYLTPHIKNTGNATAENVYLLISSLDPKITMIDSILDISEIKALDSMVIENTISFYFTDTISDRENFIFQADIYNGTEEYWQSTFSITAHLPYLQITDVRLNAEKLQPGDTFQGQFTIKNTGTKFCEPYEIVFEPNENVIISNIQNQFKGLQPNQCDTALIDFQIIEGLEDQNYLELDLLFRSYSNYEIKESIGLNLGEYGFSDDFEDESDQWIFNTPETNQWNHSEYRKVSGQYSLYCGNDDSHIYYFSNTRNIIETAYFYPGKSPRLHFWCWYNFPNYGISGMAVEILHNGQWMPLDFIGSGGALGILPTGNDWTEYEYDLSFLPEMVKTKLRLTVTLDPGQMPAEGVYIDDLSIKNRLVTFTTITESPETPGSYQLNQNYPNPFNPTTTIQFTLPQNSFAVLRIYDLKGNFVEELARHHFSAGTHHLHWNAEHQPSGIYLYQIETEKFTNIKKCLLIK
ncbi:MAG: T9SS type A sorting domain-containing protein [Candidatus Marinimicrobia bacterium]|nr:T9SS type A sorting domain-containing protein [Candidatus Neomarinimicrobiota bacterium]